MNSRWKFLIAGILTGVSLYFLGTVLVSQWREIQKIEADAFLIFISIAVPAYFMTAVLNSIAWTYAFRSTGEKLPFLLGVQIYLVSQIGKYLPGNIGHFAGRIGLLKNANYSVVNGSISIVLETLWIVAAAAILSGYAVFAGAQEVLAVNYDISVWHLILVVPLVLVTPYLIIFIFNCLPPVLQKKLGFAQAIRLPPARAVLSCFAFYCLIFLINGIILKSGAYWLFGANNIDLLHVVSLYAIVWLSGFLLPGAPGGIGIREAMLVLLLGDVYGAGVAAALAVVMRVVSVSGDLVAFAFGMLLARWPNISSDHSG